MADGAVGAVFGLSSWSILVPQALAGVAAVALLHATVRRTTGSAGAGLLAGAVLALTPVAVLMFRFNNPDALLVLLLVGSAYATLRARRGGQHAPDRWLALGGALVGLAFLTKMLQAFLVLPAARARLPAVRRRSRWRKRIGHLLVAFGAMVAGRRLVGRDRGAVAGRLAALHRRLAEQLASSS